jgi:hypothetical protein
VTRQKPSLAPAASEDFRPSTRGEENECRTTWRSPTERTEHGLFTTWKQWRRSFRLHHRQRRLLSLR